MVHDFGELLTFLVEPSRKVVAWSKNFMSHLRKDYGRHFFFFLTSELKLFSLVPGENCVAAILIFSYSKLRKQKGSKTSAC